MERAEEPEKMRARAKKNGYKNGTKYNSLTSQIVYGNFLPSPVASDATTGAIIGKNDKFRITKTGMPRKMNQNGADGSVGLARLGKMGMLPTPASQDGKNCTFPRSQISRDSVPGAIMRVMMLPTPQASEAEKASKADHQNSLTRMLKRGELLPTPRVSGQESYKTRAKRKGHDSAMSFLESNLQYQTGKTSQLNPQFVMEMMGFPPNWTLLPFLKELETLENL